MIRIGQGFDVHQLVELPSINHRRYNDSLLKGCLAI